MLAHSQLRRAEVLQTETTAVRRAPGASPGILPTVAACDELQRDRADDGDDMSFHEVLRGLGSKGGGLTRTEAAQLEVLDNTYAASAACSSEKRPLPRIAFRCDMLMCRGVDDGDDRAWRCMSCADPCDFQSL